MLDLLQETLLYIEEQNELLAHLQSLLVEKEMKYKVLHSKISWQIMEEVKKQQPNMNLAESQVKQEVIDDIPVMMEDNFDSTSSNEHTDNIGVNTSFANDENFDSRCATYSSDLQNDGIYSDIRNENFGDAESNKHEAPQYPEQLMATSSSAHDTFKNDSKSSPILMEDSHSITDSVKEYQSIGFTIPSTTRHQNQPAKYTCSYCNKQIYRKQSYTEHLRTHTGEKPYECTYCNKSFSVKSNLKTHIRLHTGERPYLCSFCSKSFTQKGSLNQHMRLHTGEKPFLCTFCNQSYAQKSGLVSHMRMHTNSRPFPCNICDMAFKHKPVLKRHMSTVHSTELS